MSARLRAAAAAILGAGLRAADPYRAVRKRLRLGPLGLSVAGERLRPAGRVVLLSVGKAAPAMAEAAAEVLGSRLAGGLVVTNVGGQGRGPLRVLEAGHPLPDARGLRAAAEVEHLVRGLEGGDLLIVLLSGGASALLPAPAEGLTLRDKARTTALLLRAGATIHELNVVRKHLSRLKGGGLARLAFPASVRALVLSDVVGDDLSTIASGPVSPDPSSFADALAVLKSRGVLERAPAAVRQRLRAGARGRVPETPKPGERLFGRVKTLVVGSNRLSLETSAREARRQGFRPLVLTSCLEGEAREVARTLVAVLRECVTSGRPASPPVCLLAGGETTVSVRGRGQGGRNQEMAVAAALPLSTFPVDALLASLATDGIDGHSDAAGGAVDRRTVAMARALGLAPPGEFLARSDSRNFLGPAGGLIVTGPTGTNVMDLTILLASKRA